MEDAYNETNTNPNVFGNGDITTRDGNAESGTLSFTGRATPTTTTRASSAVRVEYGGAVVAALMTICGILMGAGLLV